MSEFDSAAMQAAIHRYAASGGDAKAFEQGFRAGWAASLAGNGPGGAGTSEQPDADASFEKAMEQGAAYAKKLKGMT